MFHDAKVTRRSEGDALENSTMEMSKTMRRAEAEELRACVAVRAKSLAGQSTA